MNNTEVKNNNDTKKIVTLIVLIATIMISTTSATYAYLAFSANNATAVTGTVAEGGLTLTVTESALGSGNTGKMVPQLEAALGTAINNTNKCVDANKNIVCKVYTIVATSASSATMPATASIQFTHTVANTPNLKWKLISAATTVGSVGTATAATASKATFATPTFTNTNKTFTYYMVIWINETNSVQTDSGNWSATISFDTANGGITSTIRS